MAKITPKMSLFVFCFACLSLLSTYGISFAVVTTTVKVENVYMLPPATNHTGCMVSLRNTTGVTIPGTTWANNTVRNFYVAKNLGNPGMAVVLTALSNKTKVIAQIGGTAETGSLIWYVAVSQQPQ